MPTIRGTVTDASGALVAGASVTVLDVQTKWFRERWQILDDDRD